MATNGDQARVLLSKAAKDEALVRKIGSDTDIADELPMDSVASAE